jgi:hypothetical protein
MLILENRNALLQQNVQEMAYVCKDTIGDRASSFPCFLLAGIFFSCPIKTSGDTVRNVPNGGTAFTWTFSNELLIPIRCRSNCLPKPFGSVPSRFWRTFGHFLPIPRSIVFVFNKTTIKDATEKKCVNQQVFLLTSLLPTIQT